MSSHAAKLLCAFTMLAALGVADRRAEAQPPAALNGAYSGTYRCGSNVTNLKLNLEVSSAGEISGVFTFFLPSGTQQTAYAYRLFGQYDPRTAKFALLPTGWQTAPPANAAMMGMNGTFDSNELTGTITGPDCTTFQLERDREAPARAAAAPVNPAAPAPVAPAPPPLTAGATARTEQPPANARREAPPAAPRAASTQTRQAAAPSAAQRSVDDVVKKIERDSEEQATLHWTLAGLAGHQNDARRDVMNTQVVATATMTDSDIEVDVTATCFENGIRMLFFLDSEGDDAEFDWQVDEAADSDDDGVVDVPISVDGRQPHVAKGYPEESTRDPGTYYSDVMGFYFYDPGLHQRIYDRNLRGDTTFNILIDGAFGPLVKAKAEAAADSAVATAGGPLSDLVNAKSIRVGLAVKARSPHPGIDLEPQDAVFHRYVGDCSARFGGGH